MLNHFTTGAYLVLGVEFIGLGYIIWGLCLVLMEVWCWRAGVGVLVLVWDFGKVPLLVQVGRAGACIRCLMDALCIPAGRSRMAFRFCYFLHNLGHEVI